MQEDSSEEVSKLKAFLRCNLSLSKHYIKVFSKKKVYNSVTFYNIVFFFNHLLIRLYHLQRRLGKYI